MTREALTKGTKIVLKNGTTYELCGVLGRGGSAIVYSAREIKDDGSVNENTLAIKEFFPYSDEKDPLRYTRVDSFAQPIGGYSNSLLKLVEALIVKEKEISGKAFEVAEVAKIRSVLDASTVKELIIDGATFSAEGKYPFFSIMEDLRYGFKGESISTLMDKENGEPLSVETAAHVIFKVLRSLADLHRGGVLHGDIQRNNLFCSQVSVSTESHLEIGVVKFLDMGSSRELNIEGRAVDIPRNEPVFSTPAYSPPEISGRANGRAIRLTRASDIFSVGRLFQLLLLGETAFYEAKAQNGDTRDAGSQDRCVFQPIQEGQITCTQKILAMVNEILSKACAWQPKDRYQSADEMKEDIDTLLEALGNLKKPYLWTTVASPLEENYVHREQESQILDAIDDKDTQVIYIAGISGVGKSQMARAVAEHTRRPTLTVTLPGKNYSDWKAEDILLFPSCMPLVNFEGLSKEEKMSAIKEWFKMSDEAKELLVIVDNYNYPSHNLINNLRSYLPEGAKLLVTTQIGPQALANTRRSTVVELVCDASQADFCAGIFRSFKTLPDTHPAIPVICEKLGFWPVLITPICRALAEIGSYSPQLVDSELEQVKRLLDTSNWTEVNYAIEATRVSDGANAQQEYIEGNPLAVCEVLFARLLVDFTPRQSQLLQLLTLSPGSFFPADSLCEAVGDHPKLGCSQATRALVQLEKMGVIQTRTEDDGKKSVAIHEMIAKALKSSGRIIIEDAFLSHAAKNICVMETIPQILFDTFHAETVKKENNIANAVGSIAELDFCDQSFPLFPSFAWENRPDSIWDLLTDELLFYSRIDYDTGSIFCVSDNNGNDMILLDASQQLTLERRYFNPTSKHALHTPPPGDCSLCLCVGGYNLLFYRDIRIPDKVFASPVRHIANKAFMCTYLRTVNLPSTLETIGNRAFALCYDLSAVSFPLSVTQIETRAFQECKSLSSISLPEKLVQLGDQAFAGCESLLTVDIPDSLSENIAVAFTACFSLSSFHVSPNHPQLTSTDGVLYTKDGLELVAFPGGKKCDTYEIAPTVVSIRPCAFSGSTLQEITLPDKVLSIGDGAFAFCSNLETIEIPSLVSRIGRSTFLACKSLRKIEIKGNQLSIIEPDAFRDCGSLSHIKLPQSVTFIGARAFKGCHSLEEINIPDGAEFIGDSAFEDCRSIKEINIPDGVNFIGDDAFSWCEQLLTIKLPPNLWKIGHGTFEHCCRLRQLVIPEGVYFIGARAFSRCVALEEVSLPSTLSGIGSAAFLDCENLKELALPKDMDYIGRYAFARCRNLTLRVYPNSLGYQYAIEHIVCSKRS